ncbi:hypothetical protein STRIP9103_00786 [Streptomyces ipomoeae 91-03]|uniref:Uncharacterized protein n=1 Tax=Streptomyces ipomoeae 91-03 TaxID=698759 RepID=L1KY15_9ACTN|nr:hypothetical protein STRIP9103_00786 [Streptomyces ipomoeae 91-03]
MSPDGERPPARNHPTGPLLDLGGPVVVPGGASAVDPEHPGESDRRLVNVYEPFTPDH